MPALDPLDIHIGAKLREVRLARRLSLEAAGRLIGVTYQQIQKYEKGSNRIATSTLHRLCGHYAIAIGDVVEGFSGDGPSAEPAGAPRDLLDRIPNASLRQQMRELAIALGAAA